MFISFVARMAAIILDTQKMWKSDSTCIRRDEELGTLGCMNPKNWFTSNRLRAAARL